MDEFQLTDCTDIRCQIEWAKPGELSRPVVRRSNARVTEKYPSWKPKGRKLHAESLLELKAFILHDVDPIVYRFSAQPAVIRYELGGSWWLHYPDMLVETASRAIFREIKPKTISCEPDVEARTRFLEMALPLLGFDYDVLTEEEICKEPRLTNAKFLLKYGRQPVSLLEAEKIRREVKRKSTIPWGDILSGCFGTFSVAMVCRLILDGQIVIDMNADWDDQAFVSHPS